MVLVVKFLKVMELQVIGMMKKNERNRHKNVEENYIPSNLKANPRFLNLYFSFTSEIGL
jgi:hypothetical protein